MDVQHLADALLLLQTEQRLQRVGLVVDRTTLSPANRRALATLQRFIVTEAAESAPKRAPIGFAYPNAR